MKHRKGNVTPRAVTPLQQRRMIRQAKQLRNKVQLARVFGVLTGLSVTTLAVANVTHGTYAMLISQATVSATVSAAHDFPKEDSAIAEHAIAAQGDVQTAVTVIKKELKKIHALKAQAPPVGASGDNSGSNLGDKKIQNGTSGENPGAKNQPNSQPSSGSSHDNGEKSRAKGSKDGQKRLAHSSSTPPAPNTKALTSAKKLLTDMQTHLHDAKKSLDIAQRYEQKLSNIVMVDQANYRAAAGTSSAGSYQKVIGWSTKAYDTAKQAVDAAQKAFDSAQGDMTTGQDALAKLQADEVKLSGNVVMKKHKQGQDNKDSSKSLSKSGDSQKSNGKHRKKHNESKIRNDTKTKGKSGGQGAEKQPRGSTGSGRTASSGASSSSKEQPKSPVKQDALGSQADRGSSQTSMLASLSKSTN